MLFDLPDESLLSDCNSKTEFLTFFEHIAVICVHKQD